jgi:hypothetical protein
MRKAEENVTNISTVLHVPLSGEKMGYRLALIFPPIKSDFIFNRIKIPV